MAQPEQWFDDDPQDYQQLRKLADRLCFLLDVACDRHRPCGWPNRRCPYCQAVSDWRLARDAGWV